MQKYYEIFQINLSGPSEQVNTITFFLAYTHVLLTLLIELVSY